jgi:hypothetical protein
MLSKLRLNGVEVVLSFKGVAYKYKVNSSKGKVKCHIVRCKF